MTQAIKKEPITVEEATELGASFLRAHGEIHIRRKRKRPLPAEGDTISVEGRRFTITKVRPGVERGSIVLDVDPLEGE